MILKGFKEKSTKKYLNAILNARHVNVNNSKIESLGVVLNIDEINDFDKFRTLAESLNIRPNKLKIVAFTKSKKDDINSWETCFNPKDFGWKGKIKNIELQTFIDTEFDALISYYIQDELELKQITAASKAKFKIGIFQDDSRLNDFIIKTNLKQFDLFKTEVVKYLRILKKMKHEY